MHHQDEQVLLVGDAQQRGAGGPAPARSAGAATNLATAASPAELLVGQP
ncbi:hypothetical protein ACL02T_31970 [Pseudonocardia sp. RS010]